MSNKSNVIIPCWKNVIQDEDAQWRFEQVCQYIDNPDIQMKLIDTWDLIEFEPCESHLIFGFRTSDSELAALLQDNATWKLGISGWEHTRGLNDGWFDVFPHSVCAEARAWIAEKYGVREGPDQYI